MFSRSYVGIDDSAWMGTVKSHLDEIEKKSQPSMMQQILSLINEKQKTSAKNSVADKVKEMQERAGFITFSQNQTKVKGEKVSTAQEKHAEPLLFKYVPEIKEPIKDYLLNNRSFVLDAAAYRDKLERELKSHLQEMGVDADLVFKEPALIDFIIKLISQRNKAKKKPVVLNKDIEFTLEDTMDSGDMHKTLSPASR
jgi:hypothetical protein